MAAPLVTLVAGNPDAVDYTPGSAVAAGDVIVQGKVVGIATHDIPANTKGALYVQGGVWKCPKAVLSTSALGGGVLVYWDASAGIVTATSTSNEVFGYVDLAGAAAAATTVLVFKALP